MPRRTSGAYSHDKVLDLIDGIYAAAVDTGELSQTIGKVANAAGADSALLFTPSHDAHRRLWAAHEIRPESMAGYAEHYVDLDVWTHAVYRRKPRIGDLLIDRDLVPNDTFIRSAFLNEFLEPIDIFWYMGVFLDFANPALGSSDITLSLFGSRRRNPFDQSTRNLLNAITPHLRRALRAYSVLKPAGNGPGPAALNTLPTPIAVCAADGNIIYVNAAAESLLTAQSAISARAGCLHACDPRDDPSLMAAIRRTVNDSSGYAGATLTVRGIGDATSYTVVVCPMVIDAQTPAPGGKAAVVTFHPDAAQAKPWQVLQKSFALTGAEVRLLQGFYLGGTLSDVAERIGISTSTARTQIKSIFAKTGVRRQVELMQLLVHTVG